MPRSAVNGLVKVADSMPTGSGLVPQTSGEVGDAAGVGFSFTFEVVSSLSLCLGFNAGLMERRGIGKRNCPGCWGDGWWWGGNPSLLQEDETSSFIFLGFRVRTVA